MDTLLQDYGLSSARPNMMNKNGNRYKKIVYEYDLISGKVNQVKYQPRFSDQWTHRYFYDAENRLTEVETSEDGYTWEKEARYEYYLHGPLARTVLGQQQVQGVDYAYTLQGWLKGINSSSAAAAHDIGGDARAGGGNQYVGRDAIGLSLNYFDGEYKPIAPGGCPSRPIAAQARRCRTVCTGRCTTAISAVRWSISASSRRMATYLPSTTIVTIS